MILNLREAESFVRCEPIVAAPSMKSAAPDLTFFTHLTYTIYPLSHSHTGEKHSFLANSCFNPISKSREVGRKNLISLKQALKSVDLGLKLGDGHLGFLNTTQVESSWDFKSKVN